MSLTTDLNIVKHDGNGATLIFAYTFKILKNTDLEIKVGGVLQVLTTDYTVSGVGDATGGNVTFTTAPASGTKNVVISRIMALTQEIDLTEASKFPIDSVEEMFDRNTMQIQQNEEIAKRAVRPPRDHTSASWDGELPDPGIAGNRDKGIFIKSDGLGVEVRTVSATAIANPLVVKGDLLSHDGTNPVKVPVGANDEVVQADSTDTEGWVWRTISLMLAKLFTTKGDVLSADGTSVLRKAVGTNGQMLRADSSQTDGLEYGALGGHLSGLGLANNGGNPTNDIDIAVGEASSEDPAYGARVLMALETALTKRITTSFVAGTNQGGLSSSLTITNDTWYHVHLILVAGAVDVGFDTSVVAANLITDHSATKFRRIGSVRRGAEINIAFSQDGDEFLWDDPSLDIDVSIGVTTAVLRTLLVPLGVKVHALYNALIRHTDAADAFTYFSSPDVNDEVASQTAAPLGSMGRANTAAGAESTPGAQIVTRTNASSQIRSRVTDTTNVTMRIATLGWWDQRGKD